MDGAPQINPYVAPKEEARTSGEPSDLGPGESLAFAGTVRPETLREALRSRFSWAGFATLLVGGMVCWAGSPPSFFNPFVRVGRVRVDFMDELLAVTSVGFVLLALWHAVDGITPWGVYRKERFFLRRAADLYTTRLSGAFFDDHAYVCEDDCESWLSFAALNHFQANDRVAFLEWGSGAGGVTVLTRDLFATPDRFARACRLLQKRERPAFDAQSMRDLPDYFWPETVSRWPEGDEGVLARSDQVITYRDAGWATLRTLPASVLGSSRPLHLFFGALAVTALVFAEHLPAVPLVVAAIWLTILLLGAVLGIASVRHFFWRGDERLLASQTLFTEREVQIATTVGYFRAPWTAFRVRECTPERIVLSQRGHEAETSEWRPKHFDSAEHWQRLQQFLARGNGAGGPSPEGATIPQ